MRRAFLFVLAWFAGTTIGQTAESDRTLCLNMSGVDSINACTRIIANTSSPRELALAHYVRGILFQTKAEHDRAIADYDEAIRLNLESPKLSEVFHNRGIAYEDKGNYDRAIADFNQAITLSPDTPVSYFGRARAYARKGDRGRAIADFARADAIQNPRLGTFELETQAMAKQRLQALLDQPTLLGDREVSPLLPPPLRRLALVIANGRYTAIRKLTNPEPDGTAVAKTLRDLGFEVTEERDLAKDKLKSAVRRFAAKVENERPDWALVYYSGHGVETRRGALMLPVDILEAKDGEKPSIHDVEEDATAVGGVIERLQDTKALTLVVFDACREDGQLAEFSRRLDMKAAGLATLRDVRGAGLRWGHNGILFSTAEGTYAWDGEPGQLSAFAKSFIGAINTEGLELTELVKRLYDDVEKTTSKVMKTPQRPELRGQIEGKHYFRPPGAAATTAASQGKP